MNTPHNSAAKTAPQDGIQPGLAKARRATQIGMVGGGGLGARFSHLIGGQNPSPQKTTTANGDGDNYHHKHNYQQQQKMPAGASAASFEDGEWSRLAMASPHQRSTRFDDDGEALVSGRTLNVGL